MGQVAQGNIPHGTNPNSHNKTKGQDAAGCCVEESKQVGQGGGRMKVIYCAYLKWDNAITAGAAAGGHSMAQGMHMYASRRGKQLVEQTECRASVHGSSLLLQSVLQAPNQPLDIGRSQAFEPVRKDGNGNQHIGVRKLACVRWHVLCTWNPHSHTHEGRRVRCQSQPVERHCTHTFPTKGTAKSCRFIGCALRSAASSSGWSKPYPTRLMRESAWGRNDTSTSRPMFSSWPGPHQTHVHKSGRGTKKDQEICRAIMIEEENTPVPSWPGMTGEPFVGATLESHGVC